MIGTTEYVFEADFNNVDANDRVLVSLRYLNQLGRPEVGSWVRLADAEGNVCIGEVEEIRNLIVAVRPDWDSWMPAIEFDIRGVGSSGTQPAWDRAPATAGVAPEP